MYVIKKQMEQQSIPIPTTPVAFHYLSKIELIRYISQVHKVHMKYAYSRTKPELLHIIEQLEKGTVPDKIDALH
jgi:hypothetical protein